MAVPRSRVSLMGLILDLCLLAVLAGGAYLRWLGQNWDQDTHLHPDERFFTMVETALKPVDSFGQYFDNSTSTLNPFNTQFTHFVYGQLPFVIVRYAAEWTKQADYGTVHLIGRSLSALSDLLAIAGIYLIGRRLYNHWAGVIAASLSALAVMQIQQSHFFTPDNFGTLFTVVTMYFAVLAAQSKRPFHFALAGVGFGLALATRINLLPLFGEVVVAVIVSYADDYLRDGGPALRKMGLALVIAAIAAVISFRVAMPMAFGEPGQKTSIFSFNLNTQWIEQMRQAQAENSGEIDAPPGKQWTNRPAIVFPLVNMVLWGMGIPLGLLSWAGFAWAAWQALRGDWKRHALPLTWAGGYFFFMATRWVKSVRYFLPIYPFLILFAAWAIVELWQFKRGDRELGIGNLRLPSRLRELLGRATAWVEKWARPSAVGLAAVLFVGTGAWAWAFTRIYTRDYTRVAASKWIYRNLPGVVALNVEDGQGRGYADVTVPAATVFLDQIAPQQWTLTFPAEEKITGITFPHIASMLDVGPSAMEITVSTSPDSAGPHTSATTPIAPPGPGDARGGSLTVPLPPMSVAAKTPVYVTLKALSGGVTITGPGMANESWDDPLPVGVEGYPGWDSIYRNLSSSPGGEIHPYNEDDENKRQDLANWLDEADYLFISSQRAMWSLPRLPLRYPLTIKYYQSMFDGSLGFDLVASFQSNPTLGPVRISDVGGLAAWGKDPTLPIYNDNILSSEEAFSVYDHPPVWLFKKRADYDPLKVRALLASVDLSHVLPYTPVEASRSQKTLMLPPDRLTQQRAGGTWSQMFDPDSLLNRFEILGAVAWWLSLVALGWIAFPLSYVALKGLPDAGYPAAKTLALLVVAWLAWMLGSFKILPFTRLTIFACALLLAGISAALAWPRREALWLWIRARRNYIVTIEVFALALFLFSLFIRWGNSDLWHPAYGGEKPMDFSYFNAVLKSTSFPPYDPWFAGGYINYYYFGFVIVSVLTKLLGIVPAFAYNLILPTLFSATGMGAFSVAYNLVEGNKGNEEPKELADETSYGSLISPVSLSSSVSQHWISPGLLPYVAGVAAALLIVVLGNLGEVQVMSHGLQQVAGDAAGIHSDILGVGDFSRATIGLWKVVVERETIPIGTGSWYWDATRIIPPGEGEAGPITEFPFFTFLYADLHAHMIDLPLTLLALLWGVAFAKSALEKRSWVEWGVTFAVAGLVVGVLNPTNSWDYPAYLLLGVLAIAFANWLTHQKIDRAMLLRTGIQAAVLIALTRAFFLPYSQWYGAGYNAAEFWKGSKTTIESYLYIYGLFFFLMVTVLVRETRRWLAETPADILHRKQEWLGPLLFAIFGLTAFVFELYVVGYHTALLIVPLATWAGLMMLRGNMPTERRIAFALMGLGLALTSVVELVVLKGDISGMNTVFKFYLQVWVLFSVVGGACLARVLAEFAQWKSNTRSLWLGGLTVLV
ncbi:MAG: glycosyltransferase family 39 protein, partial [Chloroflexi bacterium]|nr:glycosyltransferase family 39 protein [Chloroflexota bacterium]